MSQFLAQQIKRLTARANELAHNLAGGAKSTDDYMLGVGRYREVLRIRGEFEAMIKKAQEPEEPGDPNDLDLSGDDDNDAAPTPVRVQRAARPRGWGGGG